MIDLTFVERSSDDNTLILMDEDGQEYHLQIDDHLARSVTSQPKSAATSSSSLGVTPRDIQTRIRRGESPEDIAHEANVDVERILRYAGPVLAERTHMAQRARLTFLKQPGRNEQLGEIVASQLLNHDVEISMLVWDSWRRDDERWNVTVTWPVGSGSGLATWIFDPVSQSLISYDEQARLLCDEQTLVPSDQSSRPRLVGLPTTTPSGDSMAVSGQHDIDPPAWLGPGHPTMPIPLSQSDDDSPSWDDILFGSRPTDN